MNIELRGVNVQTSEAIGRFTARQLTRTLGRFTRPVKRVIVRLQDDNGPRRGIDKTCRITIDLVRRGQVSVQARADDAYVAVSRAAERAGWAVGHRLTRARDRRRRGVVRQPA
ncbi:MAG TPA: HPF/RaiA family ribosome-associated protein [Vicinamibacterales bacterium]|jgi:ribosomal subunit interface protein